MLFGRVKVGEPVGEQIPGGESDFLSADRDRWRNVGGVDEGRRHHRSEYQSREPSSERGHAVSTSISCRLV